MTKFKGRGLVQLTGRRSGKSAMQAYLRLWQDINNVPIKQMICNEGQVYGAQYYTVEPIGGNWVEMEAWCFETYGETSSIWEETKNLTPTPLKRWYMNNRKFWFREEADRTMFILRWQ